ncbi:MAG: ABC transporter ATP-binding protein [Myxococcales bacterium]|nr:ABC transporter ATP-binding protein [Myxococcales bacterium]
MISLAEHAGAAPSHGDHRIAVALADAARAHPAPEDWPQRARLAGERLDLAIATLERTPLDVAAAGGRQGPLATLVVIDGRVTVVAIDSWLGRQARLRIVHGRDGAQEEVGWVSGEQLASHLQLDPEAALPWLLAEPATTARFAAMPHATQAPSPSERLRTLLRLEAPDLWVVVTYAVGVGIFTLATPIAVQALVNTVAFGALLQPLVVLSILLLAGLTFAGALRAMQAWVVEHLQQRWMVRVISDLAHRLPRICPGELGRHHAPELVNRFFDVVTVQKAASSLLLDGLSVLLQAAIGMLVLGFYHPLLLAFDVVLLAAVALIIFGFGKPATETAIKESKAKYNVAAWLEEIARHPRTFKGVGGPELAAARADELARDYLSARRIHFRFLFRQIVGALGLQAVASAALLGLGGWLVIARQLTLGQLVAAELIVSVVVAAFAKFGKHLETYYDLVAAIDKLGTLADLPLEEDPGEFLPQSDEPASLAMTEVKLVGDGGRVLLDHVDLEVEAGASLAILGRASSGKSRLAALLDGLASPDSGRIRIAGVDLRDRSLADLRRTVIVAGAPEIFAGSLVDNVRLDRHDITRAEVRELLIDLGLEPLLRRLDGDLDARLLTNGAHLSESEALRIGLARAIVARPRILVIDGVLDAVDEGTREAIRDTLHPEDPPWTLIVLTRHPAIAGMCQRIVALEGGTIRPLGASAPLTRSSRPYTR